mmetsp:Transcript_4148/g.5885  ORF Transcript_4148/g.5885 Transcript_4148/m.5885 type:complete len:152 (-) Transcript_4148:1284-1739(-)
MLPSEGQKPERSYWLPFCESTMNLSRERPVQAQSPGLSKWGGNVGGRANQQDNGELQTRQTTFYIPLSGALNKCLVEGRSHARAITCMLDDRCAGEYKGRLDGILLHADGNATEAISSHCLRKRNSNELKPTAEAFLDLLSGTLDRCLVEG